MTRSCAIAFLIVLASVPATAKFAGPANAPVERLLANTRAWIKEHPDDATGPYTLARIHYLAFAWRTVEVPALSPGTPGELPSLPTRGRAPPVTGEAIADPSGTLHGHLNASVDNFRKALALAPNNALFHLGLASVSEAALTSGLNLGQQTDAWRDQAIEHYRIAFELSVNDDVNIKFKPLLGLDSLVSFEAGQRFVAMVTARGIHPSERAVVDKVNETVAVLRNKPRGPITPIIFSLERTAPLHELIDSRRAVEFDLDGTQRPQRYPWLQSDTAILVWDPGRQGNITSGHQLFGSVTFQMFWSDGYRALDALDDNRDGKLSGDELKGLAVWRDVDGDGKSRAVEVTLLHDVGVAALSVRGTQHGSVLGSSAGVVMTDGRVLPSYDWMPEPVDDSVRSGFASATRIGHGP